MYCIISVAQIWPPVSFSWKSRFSKNVLYKIHIDIRVWQKCNFFENFVLLFFCVEISYKLQKKIWPKWRSLDAPPPDTQKSITSIKSKKINQHQISRRLVYHARYFEKLYFFLFYRGVTLRDRHLSGW